MKKNRVHVCQFCNAPYKRQNNCQYCQEKISMDNKIKEVMHEFKQGKLYTSHGGKVIKRKQAVAIALSQARRRMKENY